MRKNWKRRKHPHTLTLATLLPWTAIMQLLAPSDHSQMDLFPAARIFFPERDNNGFFSKKLFRMTALPQPVLARRLTLMTSLSLSAPIRHPVRNRTAALLIFSEIRMVYGNRKQNLLPRMGKRMTFLVGPWH